MSTFQARQAALTPALNDNGYGGAYGDAHGRLLPFPLQPAEFDFASYGFEHLALDYDAEAGALWMRFTHPGRPCFTPELLSEMSELERRLSGAAALGALPANLHYLVRASARPGVWCYGGDLERFVQLIRAKDENSLRAYAHRCVDLLYRNYRSFDLPITTVGLVQGDALGGGFESLLSDDLIIAERGVRMGLPEILFNLFPGMGAYSFLARKLGSAVAKRLITSGELYTAEELHDLGVVDVLAEPGTGAEVFRAYAKKHARRRRTVEVLRDVDRRCQPVTHEELIDVTELWIERALELDPQDLRKMERLAQSQARQGLH
ncbi:MAG: enoyl-CoA hydratase [Geminicoccaceae bacterium]|nr:MAG: enoyl-CoA hydratase [Geminicoccaceae bacterium]